MDTDTARIAAEEAVRRGIELLDEKVPGWRDRVDWDTFDIGECGYCILGQLFGDYWTGLVELEIDRCDCPECKSASYYGFTLSSAAAWWDNLWDNLQATWIKLAGMEA